MPDDPRPFSSDWLHAPPKPPEPRKRWNRRVNEQIVRVLAHLPGERVMRLLMVFALLTLSAWLASPASIHNQAEIAQAPTPVPTTQFDNVPQPSSGDADISTDDLEVTEGDPSNPLSTPEPTEGPNLSLSLERTPEVQDGSLLPQYRLLLFYGFPGNPDMGILGEYDKDRLLELLKDQAAEYEAADPSRPVKIAFEVIASVGQDSPQTDGSWLQDTPSSVLTEYADYAASHDMIIFFDVQIGRRTVQTEVEGLRPWLEQPHVHLALDPEFSIRRDDWESGKYIGTITHEDVTWTQNYLVELTTSLGLPPKVLIVHQFTESMISGKENILPVPGVQLIIDMDGHGAPDMKRSTYHVVITSAPIEYHGIKLFYRQDSPLMTPEDVLDLSPVPDLIIYQ